MHSAHFLVAHWTTWHWKSSPLAISCWQINCIFYLILLGCFSVEVASVNGHTRHHDLPLTHPAHCECGRKAKHTQRTSPANRHQQWYQWVNSLAPGKFEWNFRHVIFKQILVIDGWGISWEIALIWMSLDFTDDQSTLDQVMAWCRQATSHYLSQCWPRSLLPYGVTRPQRVKIAVPPGTTFTNMD